MKTDAIRISALVRRVVRAACLCIFGPLIWFGASGTALAHQVWLEQDSSGAKLYFGEFGDNLHERSPGYLDKLGSPVATLISRRGDKPVEVKKLRDSIALAGRANKGESVVALDPAYPLLESKEGDKTLRTAWTPAARFVSELAPQVPKLALDVVPTNADGEFQVVFRGAPLARVDVSLVAASGWSLRATTDDNGKVRFDLAWKSAYALLVRHKELAPGKRKTREGAEEPFDRASFATTLTFVTNSGLPPPPPPAPAAPNTPD